MHTPPILAAALIAASVTPYARAIDAPDYGFDWVTITHPGNPAFDGPWAFSGGLAFFRAAGKVDRVYRITRTEVTVAQWFEFVQAYAPYFTGIHGDGFAGPDYTSIWIGSTGWGDGGVQGFRIADGAENFPTSASFIHIARFCNWLHNDKAPGEWAFQDGAYDIAVLQQIADGDTSILDFRRRPDARYWVADVDEWTKAVFYDPNKHGPGQGGYWKYPHSSDTPLVEGVDTNAGWDWYGGTRPMNLFNVGSYPHARSPWGLLDASGGAWEWLDYEWNPWMWRNDQVLRRGAAAFVGDTELQDQIGRMTTNRLWLVQAGFRLASVHPCAADLSLPYGLVDLADIGRFIEAFLADDPAADLAPPAGSLGPEDVVAFVASFQNACQ